MFRVLILLLLLCAPAVAQVGQGYSPAPGLSATGDASATTSLATGGTASPATTNAARFAERLDVRADYHAVGDGVADDSAAFAAAINRSNTLRALGIQSVIYVPSGHYLIKSTPLPIFLYAGNIQGDGTHRSFIVVDPTYSGDLFSWSEAWAFGTSFSGPSVNPSNDRSGPMVRGITVLGDTTSANVQNAFMFYDRDDFVVFEDVDVFFLNGRCFAAGLTKNQALAYMRESQFYRVRFSNCGAVTGTVTPTGNLSSGSATVASVSSLSGVSAGMKVTGTGVPPGTEVASASAGSIVLTQAATASGTGTTLTIYNDIPVVEINAVGAGDTSNQIDIYGLDIFTAAGTSLVIRNQNATKGVGQIRLFGTRIEAAGQGDEFQVGDTGAAYGGVVTDVHAYGTILNTSSAGNAAIGLYANTITQQPYSISIEGDIPTGSGTGINVQAGRLSKFTIGNMGTSGTQLVVGSTALVGAMIEADGYGGEGGWTTTIGAVQFVKFPAYTTFGNLVAARSSAAFGEGNQPGVNGFATGFSNRDGGTSASASGQSVSGRLLYAANCIGGATFSGGSRGDAQRCEQVLAGNTTASTGQLTADRAAASTNNILNLNFGTGTPSTTVAQTCSGYITAVDTTSGIMHSWFAEFGMKRQALASTTVISWQTITDKGGDALAATPSLTADTTRAGATVNVAAAGVADTIHYSLNASCGQVQ